MRAKFLIILLATVAGHSLASEPYLAFSDLVNGPASGLNDNVGQGAIVTIWGANLGPSSASNRVIVTDSAGVERDGIVYYWKNADGALPSGPADLYSSHRFQEIAFSIPNADLGPASIRVEVNGDSSNSLPFTIRNGQIYHVSSSGSDSSGNGSWGSPWQTLDHTINVERPAPGSLIYLRGTVDGSNNGGGAVFSTQADSASSQDNQLGIVAYPNTHPELRGRTGLTLTRVSGVVVSKLSTFTSSHALAGNDQTGAENGNGGTWGIATTAFGRVVGNALTEQPNGCSSKFQGAIVGSNGTTQLDNSVDNLRIYGNEIFDYGCAGSSPLHHTTYLSIRQSPDDPTVSAWKWGWNYLHDNEATLGIHNWDKDENGDPENSCGNVTGVIEIHDNVIVNQGGAGISAGGSCEWGNDWYIYNNIIIDSGLAAAWNGVDPDTSTNVQNNGISLTDGVIGNFIIANNLIWGWNRDGITNRRQSCIFLGDIDQVITWTNNICIDKYGMNYEFPDNSANPNGANNVWYSEVGTTSSVPGWGTASVTEDPQLFLSGGVFVTLDETSVLKDSGSALGVLSSTHDIYGTRRSGIPEIGPVEIGAPRPEPPDVQ